MKKLLFISVKITDLNGAPKTKDVLIAEKLKEFLLDRIKASNNEIDIFLSDNEVEKLSEGPYREIVMEKLQEAENLLFICSDVNFLNESHHIQNELNGYLTALDAKDKPENSILRLTSKQFDSQKKNIVKKLQIPLNTFNNIHAFDSSKDLESILVDLKPAFETIYKLISKIKNKKKTTVTNKTREAALSTRLGYDSDYSDFKTSFLGVKQLIDDFKLDKISTYIELLSTDIQILIDLKDNIETTINDFEDLIKKFDEGTDSTSIKQEIWNIFSAQVETKITIQTLLDWFSIYEKAVAMKKAHIVFVKKGFFTLSVLRKLILIAKKKEALKTKQSKPLNFYQEIYNSFWGKGKEVREQVIMDNGVLIFDLLSGSKKKFGIKEIQLTIAKK